MRVHWVVYIFEDNCEHKWARGLNLVKNVLDLEFGGAFDRVKVNVIDFQVAEFFTGAVFRVAEFAFLLFRVAPLVFD